MKLNKYGHATDMRCVEAIKGNCDRMTCFHYGFHTRQKTTNSHSCDESSYFSSMVSTYKESFYILCSATKRPRCIQKGSLEEVMLKIIRKKENEENK